MVFIAEKNLQLTEEGGFKFLDLRTIKAKADTKGTKLSIFHQKKDKSFLEHFLTLFDTTYKESKNIILTNDEFGLRNLKREIQIFSQSRKKSKLLGIRHLFNIGEEDFILFLSEVDLEIKNFLKNRNYVALGFRITTLFKNHKDKTFLFKELSEILENPIDSDLYSTLQRFVKKKKLIEIRSPLENIPFKFSAYKLTEDEKIRLELIEEQRIKKIKDRGKQFRGVAKRVVFEAIEVLGWPSIDEIVLYITHFHPSGTLKYTRNYVRITLNRLFNDNNIVKKGRDKEGAFRYAKSFESKEIKIETDASIEVENEIVIFESSYFKEEIPLKAFGKNIKIISDDRGRILFLNIISGLNVYSIYYKDYNELGGLIHFKNNNFKLSLKEGDFEIRFPTKREFISLLRYLRENKYLREDDFFSIKAKEEGELI